MELLTQFIDIVLHLDQHLTVLIQNYGSWVYLILFLIIFCETGLVVTPFLPGDSLLFVAGALCATGALHVHGVFALLALAAFSGDNTNYWIGRYLGPRVFSRQRSRLFNPAHLQRTQRFYERHGFALVPEVVIAGEAVSEHVVGRFVALESSARCLGKVDGEREAQQNDRQAG